MRTREGRRIIRPDQVAEPDVLALDWPRADLDIACLELLIGLVHLADPVEEVEDWEDRRPDSERLRARLAPLAPAFNLGGDGPRFLQDLEPLDGEPKPVDMLFIDSAGESTATKNADLLVHRDRYPRLDPATAAMALYTLQAHAPSGGAGNRTSMRGGGPMVTLVQPAAPGLWPLIWANVPLGTPQGVDALPWMRPTHTSEGKQVELQPVSDGVLPEHFFGMPRRLRLVFDGDAVVGVIQKPWGVNYVGWVHPLTPYYRQKEGADLLPVHPRAGLFGYRNWLGVVADAPDGDLRRRAACLRDYAGRVRSTEGAGVIVAGWAMDNMKPLDFILSRQPFVDLPEDALLRLRGMVAAAETAGVALRMAGKAALGESAALEALRESFFQRTETAFSARAAALPAAGVETGWLSDMRAAALALFDEAALPGLAAAETDRIEALLSARDGLVADLSGHRKLGKDLFTHLSLPLPERRKKKEPQA